MTKKRIGTKKRKVKKQMKRKSRKMRKNMKGGNRAFVEKISRCIPQGLPDIPISSSGYQNNDDNWTKLAKHWEAFRAHPVPWRLRPTRCPT